MDFNRNHIIIENDLHDLASDRLRNYVAHVLCYEGQCEFTFNLGRFHLQGHDSMIVRQGRMVEDIITSEDFKAKVIYVDDRFIEMATPQSNYGMQGALSLFLNPVMPLTDSRFAILRQDFDNIETRLNWQQSMFHQDVMINAVQTMIIDYFEIHAHIYKETEQSTQTTKVMSDFLAMLSRGDYREHRDIAYYADQLCVSHPSTCPKSARSQVAWRPTSRSIALQFWRYHACCVTRRSRSPKSPTCSTFQARPTLAATCRTTSEYLRRPTVAKTNLIY